MDYIGKAVRFNFRTATGHATMKVSGQTRVPSAVPTELRQVDALVLSQAPASDGSLRLTLLYNKDGKMFSGEEWKGGLSVAYDVPHLDHDDAKHSIFWSQIAAETKVAEARPAEVKAAEVEPPTLPEAKKESAPEPEKPAEKAKLEPVTPKKK